MKNMKAVASSMPPKAAVSTLTRQGGGELNANPCDVPRDHQKISDLRRTNQSKKTLMFSTAHCKLAEGTSDSFVCDVKAAPSPRAFYFLIGRLKIWFAF